MSPVEILSSILLATSLCADCFAVSSCSSVTLESVGWRKVLPIALAFGFIHTSLLLLGWLLGGVFVGLVEKAAGVIGFLLLLYVGGSMIIEAAKGRSGSRNLNGIVNVLVGGVATSMDALAVGVSMSMEHSGVGNLVLVLSVLFIMTLISVSAGIFGGSRIGRKVGKPAEIAGGVILIAIGVNILLTNLRP